MKIVYLCDDDINSIYSALYIAWYESRDKDVGVEFNNRVQNQLFCHYISTTPCSRKALLFEQFIQKHLGSQTYWDIFHALLSDDSYKAEAVFKLIQAAREISSGSQIMHHLSHPDVAKVFELSRQVGNESHLYCGFIRFRELNNGVMYSEISPKSQVLTCIGDFFTNRFPSENWMIYDKTHQVFMIHQKQKNWVLVEGPPLEDEIINDITEAEILYEGLWKSFHNTIAIEERENPKCQRNHLPIRFRGNMTEFMI